MISDRARQVLLAVVESYITKPEPVGSRFVTKRYAFNLSSATIRNIMADLEDMGFLIQPHTSAGRIPTDRGFRYYVDSIASDENAQAESLMVSIRERLESMRRSTDELIKGAAELLADLSENLVFAMPLVPDMSTLNRISLFRYRGAKTVVVLITNEGAVKNRIIDTDFGLTQKELNRVADFLNSEFWGYSIGAIKEALVRQMSVEKELCDMLISRAVSICNEALTFPSEELFVSGISNLLSLPEVSGRIDDIVRTIEDKHRILTLLGHLSRPGGVRVVIGSENPDMVLRDLSIVLATYKWRGRQLGSVGLIGPVRMDYSRIIPLVDMTAQLISRSLEAEKEWME
jgi:heat-inducible transcriptional repressor